MRLVLGNRNYSSWSMRAGIVAGVFGIPVETEMLWLDEPGSDEAKRRLSPAGRVPILVAGDLTVWDSLAICEYWAELYPERGLWPHDAADRARARSLAAEMHSGFQALRSEMPMNLRATKATPPIGGSLAKDLERVFEIFAGARGTYLHGEFSIADAFYAPVATRLRTYRVDVPEAAHGYMQALLAHPSVVAWTEAACAETQRLAKYE